MPRPGQPIGSAIHLNLNCDKDSSGVPSVVLNKVKDSFFEVAYITAIQELKPALRCSTTDVH